MKKLILIITVILSTFVAVIAKEKNPPTKDDIRFVHNVVKNEGLDYNDNSCYNAVYGKELIVLTIYKQYYTRVYYLKDGFVYSITEIFPDGVEYYGPEE